MESILKVRRGTIHALIGPNGAGKTTCFNLITKIPETHFRQDPFDGVDITKEKPDCVARRGLVRSFQISSTFPSLTATQNICIALQRHTGSPYAFWKSDARLDELIPKALELLEEVGLREYADAKAFELSYGRKRALEIATTLALDPPTVLLDEPTSGMGREDVHRLVALIRRVLAGRTVLMVEHNISVVADLSDSITVLAQGEILAEGNYEEISQNDDVLRRTLEPDMPDLGWPHLIVSGLEASYGISRVLHGLTFKINHGEMVALLGRNGAGKTTAIRSIMGLMDQYSGI